MLVDSHCHLPLMDGALDDIFHTASSLDIGHMLCVAVDLETFPRILDIARTWPHVFASVGIHPNTETTREPDVDTLIALAADDRVIAIGETGLDYYRSSGDLEWQRDRFRTHIHAAIQCQKPLIIHNRESGADLIRIMQEEGASEATGVMHCFVDDWPTARAAMEMGFYISFSGIVTFKNAQAVQAVAQKVPLDRLLVETDSPYLAPVPYRGKPNQPGYVHYVARFLAELRGESFESVAEQTTENFFRLFKTAVKIN